MKLGTALEDLGRGITYYPELARVLGGVGPAVVVCWLTWKDCDIDCSKSSKLLKVVHKSSAKALEQTGLTEWEFRSARNILEKIGVIKKRYRRVERDVEYEVSLSRVDELGEMREQESNRASDETSDGASDETSLAPQGASDEISDRDLMKPRMYNKEENKRENKNENPFAAASSPQPGEGSCQSLPNYDFGTFKKFYPDHRMWKHEREAKEAWNALNPAPTTKVAIIEHLSTVIKSKRWTEDEGRYVPNPQKYLAERYWEHGSNGSNHKAECEMVHKMYLSSSGQRESLCSLTEARMRMLSARYDDAAEKAAPKTPENILNVLTAAVEACVESHEVKKVPKRLTLESVFETTETFERWLSEAYQAEG